MCLAIIYTPQKKKVLLDSLPEEIVAYKEIQILHDDKTLEVSHSQCKALYTFCLFKKGLNKDTKRFRFFFFQKYLTNHNGQKYKQGFHCYEDIKDTCLLNFVIKIRIKKKWILEMGKQDIHNNRNTYVVSNFVIDSFKRMDKLLMQL